MYSNLHDLAKAVCEKSAGIDEAIAGVRKSLRVQSRLPLMLKQIPEDERPFWQGVVDRGIRSIVHDASHYLRGQAKDRSVYGPPSQRPQTDPARSVAILNELCRERLLDAWKIGGGRTLREATGQELAPLAAKARTQAFGSLRDARFLEMLAMRTPPEATVGSVISDDDADSLMRAAHAEASSVLPSETAEEAAA